MKMVLLMYLEEDQRCVDRLLRELDVPVYSRLSMEGVGEGAPGWYGQVPPYESRMTFAMMEDGLARRLMEAVADGSGGLEDLDHPVRAVQLHVEQTTACGDVTPD